MPPEVQALEFEAVGEGPNLQLFLIYIYIYTVIYIYTGVHWLVKDLMFVCLSFSFFLSFFFVFLSFFLCCFVACLSFCSILAQAILAQVIGSSRLGL